MEQGGSELVERRGAFECDDEVDLIDGGGGDTPTESVGACVELVFARC